MWRVKFISVEEEEKKLADAGLNGDMFFWANPAKPSMPHRINMRLFEKRNNVFVDATKEIDGKTEELFYNAEVHWNQGRRTSVAMRGYIYGIGEYDYIDEAYEKATYEDGWYGASYTAVTYLWKQPQWIQMRSHPQYWFYSHSLIQHIWKKNPLCLDISAWDFSEYIAKIDNGDDSLSDDEPEEEKEEAKRPVASRKKHAVKRKKPAELTPEEATRYSRTLNSDYPFNDAELL